MGGTGRFRSGFLLGWVGRYLFRGDMLNFGRVFHILVSTIFFGFSEKKISHHIDHPPFPHFPHFTHLLLQLKNLSSLIWRATDVTCKHFSQRKWKNNRSFPRKLRWNLKIRWFGSMLFLSQELFSGSMLVFREYLHLLVNN